MNPSIQALAAQIEEQFGELIESVRVGTGQVTVELPPQYLLEVSKTLHDDPKFGFEQLMDVSGVDYAAYGDADWETHQATSGGFSRGVDPRIEPGEEFEAGRFAAVYQLLSVSTNRRLRLRVFADSAPPVIPSVVNIWSSANWFEREAFDLFGILFDGHPDLRRILTDYGFVGHPFRKDFPLIGNVEVRYDPDQQRVVYQPVSIEPRVLVPRVIRHDASQDEAAGEGADA